MNAFAEVLFYLVLCLNPCCTACLSDENLTRIILDPDSPGAWVWACPRHVVYYQRLKPQPHALQVLY
jgi:hypothetical protein